MSLNVLAYLSEGNRFRHKSRHFDIFFELFYGGWVILFKWPLGPFWCPWEFATSFLVCWFDLVVP